MSWHRFLRYCKSFTAGFVIGLPVYITITDLGFCVARVDGISMQPSLNPAANESDIVLLNRWAVRNLEEVKRGDVVSLISPSEPDVKLIKRVIGLEGDIIKTLGYKKKYVLIPKGHCWIEGDHRGRSYDSNTFGPVSIGLINGLATRILWPPNRWMKIEKDVQKDRIPIRTFFKPSVSALESVEDSDDEDDQYIMKKKKQTLNKENLEKDETSNRETNDLTDRLTHGDDDITSEKNNCDVSFDDEDDKSDLVIDNSLVQIDNLQEVEE